MEGPGAQALVQVEGGARRGSFGGKTDQDYAGPVWKGKAASREPISNLIGCVAGLPECPRVAFSPIHTMRLPDSLR